MGKIRIGDISATAYKLGGADISLYLGAEKLYPSESPEPDYSSIYLTIESLEDNNEITLKSDSVLDMSVSTDDGATWSAVTASSEGTVMATLNNGDKLLLKGNNTTVWDNLWDAEGIIGSTGQFNIYGNVMSLLYGDNYIGATSVGSDALNRAFAGCTNLVSAENLSLPATTLAQGCYQSMFYGCTNLTTAPELPATTLSDWCYAYMFYGCTSLTTAPELPATTLAQGCYSAMFNGCTSLTTAPELPATTLAEYCYESMFSGCRSLTTAPSILPATTLAQGCYSNMFNGCTSLTTAPELPATTLAEYCYESMFYGCTSLTTAPSILPATTLAQGCYSAMFYGCTSLNYIKMLATDISAGGCLSNWVQGVASTGTFVKNAAMTSLPTGDSGIPSGWTVEDATA